MYSTVKVIGVVLIQAKDGAGDGGGGGSMREDRRMGERREVSRRAPGKDIGPHQVRS